MNKFRICAKKLLLTYSKVNPEITALDILCQLENNISLYEFKYVISKEFHVDGGIHFHVILIQEKKVDIKNINNLCIVYKDEIFFGFYTAIKSIRHAISYVCKNKEYITNLENLKDGKLLSAKEFIICKVKEKGIEQTLMEHYEKDPEKAIAGMSLSALKKQFNDIEKIQTNLQQDKIDTPFFLKNFSISDKLEYWMTNPIKTLIIVGDSGIGKTQFCKAFAKEKNLKTLLVNHKQDFRRLNNFYECIIIDDANLEEFEETQLLSIIENQTGRSIRVLYGNVIKKANIVQMIAINQKEFESIAYILEQPRFARRILVVKPNKPFMINVNINIVNNINNKVNDKKESFSAFQEAEQLHIKETQKTIRLILQK